MGYHTAATDGDALTTNVPTVIQLLYIKQSLETDFFLPGN